MRMMREASTCSSKCSKHTVTIRILGTHEFDTSSSRTDFHRQLAKRTPLYCLPSIGSVHFGAPKIEAQAVSPTAKLVGKSDSRETHPENKQMNPHRNLRNLRNHHTLEPALKFPEPSGTNPKNHTGTHTRTNALEAETPERPHCNLPNNQQPSQNPWNLDPKLCWGKISKIDILQLLICCSARVSKELRVVPSGAGRCGSSSSGCAKACATLRAASAVPATAPVATVAARACSAASFTCGTKGDGYRV